MGNRLYYSEKWRTFHDFLLDYVASIFGTEWGNAQLRGPDDERHPVVEWYVRTREYLRDQATEPDNVQIAPMTGVVASYVTLAYNLYLLAHNAELQTRLIKRLRNRSQFMPALYETYVAAAFIKAGFGLTLEDEGDPTRTHCEFVATSSASGRTFSVEAKLREPKKASRSVANQLHKALKKRAEHERVIFIEMNLPDNLEGKEKPYWMADALSSMRKKENTLTIDGLPAPPAYVVLTNHPHHHHHDSTSYRTAIVAEGFKIPSFKFDSAFRDLREARLARAKHQDVFHVLESMHTHSEIPSTFAGEIPEFAFGTESSRLQIGQSYVVPDQNGLEQTGVLLDACVIEPERVAYGSYRLSDGRVVIVTSPLTESELAVYRRHPETFFGVRRDPPNQVRSPLELFDFLFETYEHTPKEMLLELLGASSPPDTLDTKSQEELTTLYCERLVEQNMGI